MVVVLPSANQIVRQFADFTDVDMRFESKAAFETAIASAARIPDGWMAYCLADKAWFYADKITGKALGFSPEKPPEALTQQIEAEKSERIQADKALGQQIEAEKTLRKHADYALAQKIIAEADDDYNTLKKIQTHIEHIISRLDRMSR